MQESRYRSGALAESCGWRSNGTYIWHKEYICIAEDIGMSQINYKTVNSYKFDIELLMTNDKYSIDAGAKVLSWFYRKYSRKEKYWWVRYNCGTARSINRPTCNEYKRLVKRYL